MDRDLNPACCPYEDRQRAKTVSGQPITDLHEHKGLLRGVILEGNASGIRSRVMFWLTSGRLSGKAESQFDIRKQAR